MKQAGIYKIVNQVNNQIYIGSSVNLERRKYNHFKSLLKGCHQNQHLQNAYNLYGKDNFIFEIIEIISFDVDDFKHYLLQREQFWIDNLHPNYNIFQTAGSPLGFHHSKETKIKISQTTLGKKKSKEHAKHIRDAQKGKILTEEHKIKLSEAAKKRTKLCHFTRVSIDNVIYNSMKEASLKLNLHVNTIQKRIKSKNFKTYIKL